MKRGILIVLMAFLGLTSVMAAQKVTLKCREVALKEIFARITKQTGLTVAYSSQVLNVDTKISIETENAEITEVLEKLLPATIGYKIENSSILIFKKEVSKKASTVRMKGIVFDKKTRERLAGVTLVLNDNPSVGTITDIDGVFQITAAQGSKLKVSYIGYETQLVAISPVDELKVELDQDNFKLDEVVVTGQGAEVQKRRLSSNVTTVSSKELERMKQGRIDQVLQNALPNVQITMSSGQAGATSLKGGETMRVKVRSV